MLLQILITIAETNHPHLLRQGFAEWRLGNQFPFSPVDGGADSQA
jgi:hypothetical protein